MKSTSYDLVGTVSVLLNDELNKLKDCQKEKEEILAFVEKLKAKNELEKNAEDVRAKMSANLERFKTVVSEIEKLKQKVSK